MTERLRIVNYQPTPNEIERLESEGVTLAKILTYDQPSKQDFEKLSARGYGLVDMILMSDLRKNLHDAVSQCTPLTSGIFSDSDLQEAHQTLVGISRLRCTGNPYPGKGFCLDKAREFISLAEQQCWTARTIKSNLTKLREFLNQSTV